MTAPLHVTVNRARHALLTAVSWADPANLGLSSALAQSESERVPDRAAEIRGSTGRGRAAPRRRPVVRG